MMRVKDLIFLFVYPLFKVVYDLHRKRGDFPRVMDTIETIDAIKAGSSLSRFGDGEFGIISDDKSIGFQTTDNQLRIELQRVLQSKSNRCMIGIPNVFNGMKGRNLDSRLFWTYKIVRNWRKWNKLISLDKIYADSLSTRFYINYSDRGFSNRVVEKWKEVWNDRQVIIVEGEKTKLGIGNDLFANARSIERILCPANNAWDIYDDIKKNIITKYPSTKNYLVLIALGPTATVLAYDLAKSGYHAVDVGHIDIEYMWLKMGVKKKTEVKGKAVNEYRGRQAESTIDDSSYKQQIVAIVSAKSDIKH
jgi:glycosyltransferase family protein